MMEQTTCGCMRSKQSALAAQAIVITITGSKEAGDAAAMIAGASACKTLNVGGMLWAATATTIASVVGCSLHFRDSIYHTFYVPQHKNIDSDLPLVGPLIKTGYIANVIYDTGNPLYCPANMTTSERNEICYPLKKPIQINYKPFALSANTLDLNVINTTSIMKGTPGNDLMIANENGSSIFAIGGLNYMIAGPGADKFYFSLCSTDIIDGKVGVIEGFDINLDKIDFFCTKTDVHKNMIAIFHNQVDNRDFTYVQVCGQEKCSAIALMGNIPLIVDDLILNERWDTATA